MIQLEEFVKGFEQLESKGLLLQFVQFLLWVFFIVLVTWLIRKGINRTIEDNTMRYRAKKATRFISYILIILLAIITFTGKVQYFTIAIGLISAGLAFALQEVILSVAGWIAIFSTNIYKPGDRIEINNVKGDVIDIGITKTTLMELGEWVNSDNYTGRIVQVSNAYVFKGTVHNYSTDFPFVWDEINLPIRYGSDIQLANSIIMDLAKSLLMDYASFAKNHWKKMVKKYLIENANVEPTLSLKLTDNWAEFNLRYVVDYKKRRITKDTLYKNILNAIDKTDGKVTLASATFDIVGAPTLKVDLGESK
ncbi:mechanosensitive ion channel family protein [Winogradskyella alexanderae]|uniref:Mechanosensitive ion channel family protein n=1 Tax=Winogradskyella alexanderae TaxID=2877123 RepID=A0ABS7XRY6_9FLAO|nr:mechanosensitive ion channel domain-containing protein [Winogradskyella alexanderae]MCA0131606.1 mechanosensitive ion channel family protein [Winogradskyella alexanderae]